MGGDGHCRAAGKGLKGDKTVFWLCVIVRVCEGNVKGM